MFTITSTFFIPYKPTGTSSYSQHVVIIHRVRLGYALFIKLKKKNITFICSCKSIYRNLNMPKTKWEGAEDRTINDFFKIESSILYQPR